MGSWSRLFLLGIEYLYDVKLNRINLPTIGLGLFLHEYNCLDTKLDSYSVLPIDFWLFTSELNRLLFLYIWFLLQDCNSIGQEMVYLRVARLKSVSFLAHDYKQNDGIHQAHWHDDVDGIIPNWFPFDLIFDKWLFLLAEVKSIFKTQALTSEPSENKRDCHSNDTCNNQTEASTSS